MTVEADAIGYAVGRRFADIMQQNTPCKSRRGALEPFQHQKHMLPNVAFGMELRGLLHALKRFDLRKQNGKQTGFVEQFKAQPRAAFRKDTSQFVSNPFGRDLVDVGGEFLNGLHRGTLYGEAETRSKADSAQHAEMVFPETQERIADSANGFGLKVGLPFDVVVNVPGDRILEETVNGEVATARIEFGICDETNPAGTTPIGVFAFTAKRGDLYVDARRFPDQQDAEVRTDQLRAGEETQQGFWRSAGADVVVFGLYSEQAIAYTSAYQESHMAVSLKLFDDFQSQIKVRSVKGQTETASKLKGLEETIDYPASRRAPVGG